MSSSTSSSERQLLPAELPAAEDRAAWLLRERRAARWTCALIPIAALIVVPLLAKYLLFLVFLQPPAPGFDIGHWPQLKPAIALAAVVEVLACLWLLGIELELRWSWMARSRAPLAAFLALLLVTAACLPLLLPKGRWTFAEWAKIRTPNPSFARNTLFWEAREFEKFGQTAKGTGHVGVVGSSQIYAAVDPELFAKELPDTLVEKQCLAGFGPMQYSFLRGRIAERSFNTVICWLSEFDFYREDVVPTNRLRWAATLPGTGALWEALEPADRWTNRGEIADLGFAALVPIWRNRDHIRRTVFAYWWDISRPRESSSNDGTSQLALSADFEEAKQNLAKMIGEKKLVEVNFRCFRQFAAACAKDGTELIVFEGCSHPAIMTVYDPRFRQETRRKLESMAGEAGFVYVPEEKMPAFGASDFGDPYHLNKIGREKFTRYLAGYLSQRTR